MSISCRPFFIHAELTERRIRVILSLHMKILILGAKGMLGSALAEEFKEGNEVLAWGREELDVADQAAVAAAVTSDIDMIINAAAANDIDAAEEKIDETMKTNAMPSASLADICNLLGMTYVNFSSEHVFPGKDNRGYRENDKPQPLSVFGQSKAQAEKFSLENDRTYLIRTSRLFGDQGTSANAKQSFVEKIKTAAASQGAINSVHDEVVSPTYVKDLAKAVKQLVDQKQPFGIYHITNSGVATWYQLAAKIVELAKINATVAPVARREMPCAAPRPRYGMLVNTKLPSLRSWEEALAEYLSK
jgi:dTDP-4-dehydrorhamnose reductase